MDNMGQNLICNCLLTLGRLQTICPILGELLVSPVEEAEEHIFDRPEEFLALPSVAATISDLKGTEIKSYYTWNRSAQHSKISIHKLRHIIFDNVSCIHNSQLTII